MEFQTDLLIVLPLPVFSVDGEIHIDDQACNGLGHWLDNFKSVILMCPVYFAEAAPPATVPLHSARGASRLTFTRLPVAYLPHRFLLAMPKVVKLLREQIIAARYLHFAIGGIFGDWSSVACIIATSLHRPYAVWTDRVESQIGRTTSRARPIPKRWYYRVAAEGTAVLERHVITRSYLGLFHGKDCFEAYARYSSNPHLVHNVHISAKPRLEKSEATIPTLLYAGRAHPEKGIFDWIDVMALLRDRNTHFKAVWLGDGPSLSQARARVSEQELDEFVVFRGAVSHDEAMAAMANSDLFVFCHKAPESPRCLIEALAFGLPILGYASPYPADLIKQGGGILTPLNHPSVLADSIARLLSDRVAITKLSQRAALDGQQFDTAAMFRHRSDLMKTIPARPGDKCFHEARNYTQQQDGLISQLKLPET